MPLLKRALTCRFYDSRVYSLLGWAYLNGEGVDQGIDQEILHYRKSSDFDDSDAQYLLGNICGGRFENCDGRKDMTQAARYFRLTASNGRENACVGVGMIRLDRQGVENYMRGAVAFFRRAADDGHSVRKLLLGLCYHRGKEWKRILVKPCDSSVKK